MTALGLGGGRAWRRCCLAVALLQGGPVPAAGVDASPQSAQSFTFDGTELPSGLFFNVLGCPFYQRPVDDWQVNRQLMPGKNATDQLWLLEDGTELTLDLQVNGKPEDSAGAYAMLLDRRQYVALSEAAEAAETDHLPSKGSLEARLKAWKGRLPQLRNWPSFWRHSIPENPAASDPKAPPVRYRIRTPDGGPGRYALVVMMTPLPPGPWPPEQPASERDSRRLSGSVDLRRPNGARRTSKEFDYLISVHAKTAAVFAATLMLWGLVCRRLPSARRTDMHALLAMALTMQLFRFAALAAHWHQWEHSADPADGPESSQPSAKAAFHFVDRLEKVYPAFLVMTCFVIATGDQVLWPDRGEGRFRRMSAIFFMVFMFDHMDLFDHEDVEMEVNLIKGEIDRRKQARAMRTMSRLAITMWILSLCLYAVESLHWKLVRSKVGPQQSRLYNQFVVYRLFKWVVIWHCFLFVSFHELVTIGRQARFFSPDSRWLETVVANTIEWLSVAVLCVLFGPMLDLPPARVFSLLGPGDTAEGEEQMEERATTPGAATTFQTRPPYGDVVGGRVLAPDFRG